MLGIVDDPPELWDVAFVHRLVAGDRVRGAVGVLELDESRMIAVQLQTENLGEEAFGCRNVLRVLERERETGSSHSCL